MDLAARDSYLETQVMTATPQKLRLMLIEGAIRFARQTLQHWEEENNEEAVDSLIHCRSIVTELVAAIKDDKTELTNKVTGVYLFLFQTLTEAQLRRDQKRVEDAIRVLEVERETWQLVCEKMPHIPTALEGPANEAREITAAEAQQTLGASSPLRAPGGDNAIGGGLVLDA